MLSNSLTVMWNIGSSHVYCLICKAQLILGKDITWEVSMKFNAPGGQSGEAMFMLRKIKVPISLSCIC